MAVVEGTARTALAAALAGRVEEAEPQEPQVKALVVAVLTTERD